MKKFPVEMKKSPFFEGIEDTEEEQRPLPVCRGGILM